MDTNNFAVVLRHADAVVAVVAMLLPLVWLDIDIAVVVTAAH